MGKKILNLRQQRWIVMWNEWLNDNLCEPLEQLCTYDNEMTSHGHLHFFELFKNDIELKKCLNVLYDELPEELSDNLRKAYLLYIRYKENIQKGHEYLPLEEEKLFWDVDNCYYNNEQIIYSNFIDYVVCIEQYIKNRK
jgi:hypothetical protein